MRIASDRCTQKTLWVAMFCTVVGILTSWEIFSESVQRVTTANELLQIQLETISSQIKSFETQMNFPNSNSFGPALTHATPSGQELNAIESRIMQRLHREFGLVEQGKLLVMVAEELERLGKIQKLAIKRRKAALKGRSKCGLGRMRCLY
jgi:hypothetical protein